MGESQETAEHREGILPNIQRKAVERFGLEGSLFGDVFFLSDGTFIDTSEPGRIGFTQQHDRIGLIYPDVDPKLAVSEFMNSGAIRFKRVEDVSVYMAFRLIPNDKQVAALARAVKGVGALTIEYVNSDLNSILLSRYNFPTGSRIQEFIQEVRKSKMPTGKS